MPRYTPVAQRLGCSQRRRRRGDRMKTPQLLNYERDRWIAGDGNVELVSAIDGAPVAVTGSGGLDFGSMLRHAREIGGPELSRLHVHERARVVKGLEHANLALTA